MPWTVTDIPFVIFLVIVALMPGVRNHMNKYILAREGVTYSLSRQREMLEHYRKLAGVDANYGFYRGAMIAAPLLLLAWAVLTTLFRLL